MSDYSFKNNYESTAKVFQILSIIKDDLTEKGVEEYNKMKKWLSENLDRYLEIMDVEK